MITRQSKLIPKMRWNGWLTVVNFDWLCHISLTEDRSIANIINRLIKEAREKQNGSTWNNDAESNTK